jgi:2Fe-2S ferredoxin
MERAGSCIFVTPTNPFRPALMAETAINFDVRVEPLGIVLHCSPNETLIQCAWRSGYYWPTICGGTGNCGACRCELVEGAQHAGPFGPVESLFVNSHPDMFQSHPTVRLACCMTVAGPMTVFKTGVRSK